MNRDERTLHDYLDGRLAPEARAGFERRLRDEPALAEQLADLRAIGDALRTDGPAQSGLDDAFYDRARRRFARGSSADQPARRFRLVSWEAAGLAAAAMLAVMLFVPPFVDGRLSPASSRAEEQITELEAADPPEDRGAVIRESEPLGSTAGLGSEEQLSGGRVAEPKLEGRVGAAAPRENAIVTGEPAAARPRRDAVAEKESSGKATADESFAPSPPTASAPAAEKHKDDDLAAADSFVDREFAEQDSRRQRATIVSASPPRVALAHTDMPPRSVRLVSGRAWRRLLDGPDGAALARLGPRESSARLALIGGVASSEACEALRVIKQESAWLLSAPMTTPDARGTTCAVRLPDDGRPVMLDD